MIPIGDDHAGRRRFPAVTLALIALNVVVFLYEVSLPGEALQQFVQAWGVVPREYALGRDLWPHIHAPYYTTLLTSMFIHGGWGHLLGNLLYLWVFGGNVEDRLGRAGFLACYLAAGIVAAYAQMWAAPLSLLPSVGASGAIAGVLGVYLVLFPKNHVRVFFGFFLLSVPALFMLGIWIATQLVIGFGSLGAPARGGVAYLAHVGGFATGLAVGAAVRMFRGAPPPPRELGRGQRWSSPRWGY